MSKPPPPACLRCGGTGQVSASPREGGGSKTCPACGGSGYR